MYNTIHTHCSIQWMKEEIGFLHFGHAKNLISLHKRKRITKYIGNSQFEQSSSLIKYKLVWPSNVVNLLTESASKSW